ncbi:MAG: TetR family transcriptional regulator C-terminal domain-containing protein [Marinosulfonomonas sp.]|nr:TetR family transcriptional regulator C-terminal domain-containing protein [Marinosulfonomonas sp.]
MTGVSPKTRIQKKNTRAILEAALEIFSKHGFRGSTVDQIADAAGLSKPNLLYYFPTKEAIHLELLAGLMDTWLAPLRQLDTDGDPVDEIIGYVLRKLTMAQELPRESRLFANEIVQGAPRIIDQIEGDLRDLVNEKCDVIQGWIKQGKLADVDPHHLIFSIWATTQQYADFDAQIRGILRPRNDAHFSDAARFLETFYRSALTVR